MKTSESLSNIAAALSKAQGEMPSAMKDGNGNHGSYATLSSVIATAAPVLSAHGLSFIQMPSESEPGYMALTTRILHESGEWIEDTMRAAIGQARGSEVQAAGSVISYLRRYALSSALGITTEDNDGNGAQATALQPRQQARTAPTPPVPAGISADAAKRLHAALGAVLAGTQYAAMEHNQFASSVVGRDVASLTELSTAEAKSVHGAAKVAEQEAA